MLSASRIKPKWSKLNPVSGFKRTFSKQSLVEFAKTLAKGAHIQVEGELRSREYDSKKTDTKQRVWEIRVASILKLDRAEKAGPEDQEHDDAPQEEVAA